MDALNITRTALSEVRAEQSPRETKANTVVVVAGFIITVALSGVTYLIDQSLVPESLAGYAPMVVTALGWALTALKVSRTPNAVTPTVENRVLDKVREVVDSLPAPARDMLDEARASAATRAEEWIKTTTGVDVDLDGSDVIGQARAQASTYADELQGIGLAHDTEHEDTGDYVGEHRNDPREP